MTLKEQLLQSISETDIIQHYFPKFNGKPGNYKNPLTAKDNNPSLNWYYDNDRWKFKAHNSGEQGDIWQFVACLYNLDCKTQFAEVCNRIIADTGLSLGNTLYEKPVIPRITVTPPAKQETVIIPALFDSYTPAFIAFWQSWKVDEATLKRYDVRQVNTLQNGRYSFNYSSGVVADFIVNSRHKIYIPLTAENESWTKAKDGHHRKKLYKDQISTDVFGLEQISPGTDVIICEGEKDALVLAAHGYNAISFQSATARPLPEIIQQVQDKATRVYVCYDNDEAGRNGAAWLHCQYGFIVITLPDTIKDIAEYFQQEESSNFKVLLMAAKEKSSDFTVHPDTETGENKEKNSNLPAGKGDFKEITRLQELYRVKLDKEGAKVTDIVIRHAKFYELLASFGFKRYDNESGYILVRIENNIVEQVTTIQIQDYFFHWLENLPQQIDDRVTRDMIKEKFTKGRETFFSTGNLSMLRNDRNFEFCKDTKNEAYIFYRNGYVCCDQDGWTLNDYSKLDKYVWKDQMIDRDFIFIKETAINFTQVGIFSQFMFNVCGKNVKRMQVFCSIIGYLLHNYFEGKRKAIIFTDCSLSDGDNGRTGKTIILYALQQIKPTAIINGKSFDRSDKFCFQDVTTQTQIVALNDVRRNFPLEPLYSDITEAVKVEYKNLKPVQVLAKIVIVTNRTIKIEGASDRDRVLEFEFSDHYSDNYAPEHDFPGKWFFSKNADSFSMQDWQAFDNMMAYCLSLYLCIGLQQPPAINLYRRKLIEQTNEDFVNWMDGQVSSKAIVPDVWYDRAILHQQFTNAYPDYRDKGFLSNQRNFSMCLVHYANFSGKFCKYEKDRHNKESNSKRYIRFELKQTQAQETGIAA